VVVVVVVARKCSMYGRTIFSLFRLRCWYLSHAAPVEIEFNVGEVSVAAVAVAATAASSSSCTSSGSEREILSVGRTSKSSPVHLSESCWKLKGSVETIDSKVSDHVQVPLR